LILDPKNGSELFTRSLRSQRCLRRIFVPSEAEVELWLLMNAARQYTLRHPPVDYWGQFSKGN